MIVVLIIVYSSVLSLSGVSYVCFLVDLDKNMCTFSVEIIYRENSIQSDDSHMEKWNNFMEQNGKPTEAELIVFVKVNLWRVVSWTQQHDVHTQPMWETQISIKKS